MIDLHQAARLFEQKADCGCAKRQQAMNAIIPGSGDAVRAAASTVARGLHGAARLIEHSGWKAARHVHATGVMTGARRSGSSV